MPIINEERNISHFLSDPTETKATTGVPGRGTEEAKTNDVTGRTRIGEVGIAIDMGRPGIGVHMADAEKVAMAVAAAGHHQIAPKLVEKKVEEVRKGKKTPEEAALELALYCPCGIFNQVRCAKLLEEQAEGQL